MSAAAGNGNEQSLSSAEVSARQMIDTFQQMPRLGAAILWAASRDEAMVVEHLVSIGRRSARVVRMVPGTCFAASTSCTSKSNSCPAIKCTIDLRAR